jgi:inorganic triphosphatase YgiF
VVDQLEREDTYDVGVDFVMPTLSPLAAPPAAIATETVDLEAVYYDTADAHLQRRRITMRHRVGGHDAGWHVKLPAGEARTEIHVQASPFSPPAELVDLLTGVRGGQPLDPVVRVQTRRTTHRALSAGGALVAEVADDVVRSERLISPTRSLTWREVEVELGPAGTNHDLAVAGALLGEAGARPAANLSKLGTAMGDPPPLHVHDGLGGLIYAYVRAQVDALAFGDLGLRRGEDTVYPMRVAVRRLRSTLRTFGTILDRGPTQSLAKDLRRLAAVLGPVRDHDVLVQHFL